MNENYIVKLNLKIKIKDQIILTICGNEWKNLGKEII